MCALAAAVYVAKPVELAVLLAACIALMLYYRTDNFLKLLRKMRWLLLFLLVIYAFNTPGEYLRGWPFDFAPTYEGLQAGLLQAGRISIMLAGVSILLTITSRDSLMAGFFLLLYPLKGIGLHPERLAVRLWLTLHYVETVPPPRSVAAFLESLDKVDDLHVANSGPDEINFNLPPLTLRDAVAVLMLIAMVMILS